MNPIILLVLILVLSACQVKTQDASVIVAANSFTATLVSTNNVIANGVATANITVTIKRSGLPWAGSVPTLASSGTGNTFSTCTSTDAAGISTCTLKSTKAEIKSVSVSSPAVSVAAAVTFIPDAASSVTTTIAGTTPILADGLSASIITINVKDANNNNIAGVTPTFSATNTSSGNTQTACTITNSSGISTCTLMSTIAENKTLSLLTPVSVTSTPIAFVSASADSSNSTITASSPVVADGASASTVTIVLRDASNNPVSSETPTFSATDTGAGNTYSACSLSDVTGTSVCTIKSTKAEIKTLQLLTPVIKTGGTVTFDPDIPSALTTTIVGTTPVLADGIDASTITISILDANNNPVSGQTPTFSATNTSSGNTYSACSASNAAGLSTCTLKSTVAEAKVLTLATPVSVTGSSVVFSSGAPSIVNSTITGTSSIVADGVATSTITITLKDSSNNPVVNETPTFSGTDSGSTNIYGSCSLTNSSGVSTCTLASLKAEFKTLSIATPIVKSDGTVTFIPGAADAANSSITGTGPVVADGTSTSSVTITLKDSNLNLISGVTPTFGATDTGTDNIYGTCSSTNASGVSTCTLKSLRAETKTLSISSPVIKTDGTVVFTPGAAVALNSTISGTGSVVADGSATSSITITLKDSGNNAVVGETPTFTATDTNSTNTYSACSVTDSSGVSTCTFTSLKAEVKTLSIATPVVKTDGSVTFTSGSVVASTSTITGTGPVIADGSATSTVTVTLLDLNSNPVAGTIPTFSATDSGTTNTYGTCSTSDASGISTCTLASTKAETKTLSIATPVSKADGTVVFTSDAAVAVNSTISGIGPVLANGTATSAVTITLKDLSNNPVVGQVPTFSATDTGATNIYSACSSSDASGISTCTLKSNVAEIKTLSIATPVIKADGTVTFTAGAAASANSTITGTGSVIADGTLTSTISITLKDISNNPVSGQVPTFSATNTGTTNTYGVCSSSDSSGISTCTLKSTKAETKTLAIVTPVAKTGGTVVFIAGPPSAPQSDITGTTPVSADGVSISFISVALNDAFSNPIIGVTPIFNATDTDSTNAYGACSVTDATGVATCSLSSTKAEAKTLQLTSPVAVTGSTTVTFSSLLPTSANSTITGTGPILADGSTDSTITITLRDSNNNVVAGITPTYDATDTGTGNVYDACSMSDVGGVSICSMSSTKAEVKTLRITNPVTKSGGAVTFTAGPAATAQSTISGSGPVVADGAASSTLTILLKDANLNPVVGTTPTFSATNTGSTNVQTACSATDSAGSSTCTLKSTKAESKIPTILTPVIKAGSAISFIAGAVAASQSTITGTGPVNPDGTSTSTVTITLKDANNNTVAGTIPTFSATGSNNTYGVCSSSTSLGVSTCTLASTTGETKTLSIVTPVSKADGTVLFQTGSAVALNSTISGTGPVVADGSATSVVTITLKDSTNSPVVGAVPTFTASGTSNTYGTCSATNASGISTCAVSSIKSEDKVLSIASPVIKAGATITFTPGSPSATTSTIVASNPTLADGIEACSVTITIKDVNGNPIPGQTPTFSSTGTSNTLSSCTSTDSAGESTCSMTSTKAEEKIVNLLTPVAIAGNAVDFNPNGINIQVPIELVDRGLSSGTTAVTFGRTRTSFNPDDYVAQTNTFMFEIVADNINTTTTYTINLVDSSGVVIADSAISIPPSTTMKRFSVNWTPNATATDYRVRVPGTTTASQVKVHSAKIIIEQTNAVATKLYFPLTSGEATGENVSDANSNNANVTSTTSASYVANTFMNQWLRTDANYDTIISGTPWTLEAILSTSNALGTASVGLFDKVNSTLITGSEVTQNGSTALAMKKVSFSGSATNFNNGDTVELRMKSSSTSYTTRVYKAGLWLKLKYLRKAEIPFRIAGRRSTTTSASLADARFLWDAGAWTNPTVYFQSNAATTTTTVGLMDHGNLDNGTAAATAVPGATQTPNGSTVTIKKSSALTLTNMNRYWVQHTRTAGTATLSGAFMMIQATE